MVGRMWVMRLPERSMGLFCGMKMAWSTTWDQKRSASAQCAVAVAVAVVLLDELRAWLDVAGKDCWETEAESEDEAGWGCELEWARARARREATANESKPVSGSRCSLWSESKPSSSDSLEEEGEEGRWRLRSRLRLRLRSRSWGREGELWKSSCQDTGGARVVDVPEDETVVIALCSALHLLDGWDGCGVGKGKATLSSLLKKSDPQRGGSEQWPTFHPNPIARRVTNNQHPRASAGRQKKAQPSPPQSTPRASALHNTHTHTHLPFFRFTTILYVNDHDARTAV